MSVIPQRCKFCIIIPLMEKFTVVESVVAPLDRGSVDTDQIIPKQFLRAISRVGFGQFLFDEWRYADRGELGMDCARRPLVAEFVLNQPPFAKARLLLARENFGCGSSREHAVWALQEFGFAAVIAPSFGDIFANNALKNGLLPVALPAEVVDELFAKPAPFVLRVDLAAQTVRDKDGGVWKFDILADNRQRLLQGLDDIGATLRYVAEIRAYEARRRELEPWLFDGRRVS